MLERETRKLEEDVRSYVSRILFREFRNLSFLPGEKMSVSEIAEKLNVSRTPVHDVFASLERQGFLRVESRKNTIVSHLSVQQIQESLWIHKITLVGLMEELYQATITDQNLDLLWQLIQQEEEYIKQEDFFSLREVHNEVYQFLYQLGGFSEVCKWLQFGMGDLYRLLALDRKPENWLFLMEKHRMIHEGLSKHNYDQTENAVLQECAKIEEILAFQQQLHHSFFKN